MQSIVSVFFKIFLVNTSITVCSRQKKINRVQSSQLYSY